MNYLIICLQIKLTGKHQNTLHNLEVQVKKFDRKQYSLYMHSIKLTENYKFSIFVVNNFRQKI